MANVIIDEAHLEDIADAIRKQNGSEDLYKPRDMAAAIEGITFVCPEPHECDKPHIPEEASSITGNCTYRFAYGGWDWFVEELGDKITTNGVSNASNMFTYSKLKEIPFDINLADSTNGASCSSIFNSCNSLEKPPYVKGKISDMGNLFNSCNVLREIPDDWAGFIDWSRLQSYNYAGLNNIFTLCYKLRRVPDSLISKLTGIQTSAHSCPYYQTFRSCYSLEEVRNLPIQQVTLTSNCFDTLFNMCYTLKDMTFATKADGSPYTANWKSQTITLSAMTGYVVGGDGFLRATDFTEATMVTDDASYQALKNNPDWWSEKIAYSKYNHDSAVNTINSLPDTSAYLASAGGTNTIKFSGAAGSATDGGAINTLTEEEIAVAVSRGWAVSFV